METKKINLKRAIAIPLILAATLVLWFLPTTAFGMEGLTLVEQRVIAIFAMAAFMWMFEVIPTWCTSVLVIVLMLLTTTDQAGFSFFHASREEIGSLISYKSVLSTFADPTIMLFLGGFVLAICATKVNLDVQLAKIMMKPFGKKPKFVLLGFLLVIGTFSMVMSNTATAAMMLAFLAPVIKSLPADGKGKLGLTLAIPVAANLGGIGTPIGTPPNAIVLRYLNENLNMHLGFADWSTVMIPFVVVMLLIAWVLLLYFFPFKAKEIDLKIEGVAKKDSKYWVVMITFLVTIFLWMTDQLHGISANVIAMIPVGVFSVSGVLTKEDLKEINWSVLWMVAGGFAIGVGLDKTGLAIRLVNSIPFASWQPWIVLIVSGLLAYFLSNFISHSAAANLIVPVLAAVASALAGIPGFEAIGGAKALLIGVAIACSLAMLFPISTPPNAIAHSTGLITTKDMTKIGIIIGLIGFILGYAVLILFLV